MQETNSYKYVQQYTTYYATHMNTKWQLFITYATE
jgi:hypothetical protein